MKFSIFYEKKDNQVDLKTKQIWPTSEGLAISPFLVVPSADDTALVGDCDSGEAVFCLGETTPWDSAPSIPTCNKTYQTKSSYRVIIMECGKSEKLLYL